MQPEDHAGGRNASIPKPDHPRETFGGLGPATRFLFSALPTLTRSPGRGVTGYSVGNWPTSACHRVHSHADAA